MKELFKLTKISTFLIAALFLLPTFVLILTSSRPSKVAFGQQPQYAESATQTALNNNLNSALNNVIISQSGVVFGADNFKQVALPLAQIQRLSGSNDNTSITPIYESGFEQVATSGGSTILLSGETRFQNVLYVVGALTLSFNDNENDNVSVLVNRYSYNGAYLAPTSAVTETVFREADETTPSAKVTLSAAANSEYEALIYKVRVVVSNSTTIAQQGQSPQTITTTNGYEFYIVVAKNFNYDDGLLKWTQSNSPTNIYLPGEGQIYGDIVSLTISNKLERSVFNELYLEFWFNGQPYRTVFTQFGSTYYALNLAGAYDELVVNNPTNCYVYYNNDYVKYSDFDPSSLTNNNANAMVFYDVSEALLDTTDVSQKQFQIKFNKSGEYRVRVYDSTTLLSFATDYNENIFAFNDYAYANKLEFNFTVKNQTSFNGFYYTIKSQEEQVGVDGEFLFSPDAAGNLTSTPLYDNKYIVSEETRSSTDNFNSNITPQGVNNAVKLDFYSISNSDIVKIYYDKYSVDGSDVLSSDITIAEVVGGVLNIPTSFADADDNAHATVTLTDEGTYYVNIIFNSIISGTNHNAIRISFQILNGIRQSYKSYNLSSDNLANNVVLTSTETQNFSFSYGDFLGSTTSSFKLKIAKSVPSISGVANQSTQNSSVTLRLTGVATSDIGSHVVVVRDGTRIFDAVIYNSSEDTALNYILRYGANDLGTYNVSITDAMGNTARLQFTIAKEQNAAGIILIVILSVIALAALIFIIRARSKVAVR